MTLTRRFIALWTLFTLAATITAAPWVVAATPVGPDTPTNSVFGLDAYSVTIILGFIIPLVNGLVTKVSTSSGVKAIITLMLSAIAGVINVSLTDDGGAIISQATIKSAVLTLLIAIVTYLGVFKPLDITSSATKDGTPGKLANVGIK